MSELFDLNSWQIMESFAKTLIRLRTAKGWSQSELSRKSGVSQPLISMYEGQEDNPRRPTIDNLMALAKALHVTPNEILGWPEDTPTPSYITDAAEKLASLPPDHPTRKAIETLLGLEPGENKTEGDKKD